MRRIRVLGVGSDDEALLQQRREVIPVEVNPASDSDRRGEHSDNVEAGYGVTFREANGQVTPKPAYEAYQRLTQHCPPGSMRPRLDDSGEVWTARWRKPDGTPVVATWHPRGDGKVMFRVGE